MRSFDIAERVWKHVPEGEGCREWQGERFKNGYGRLVVQKHGKRQRLRAHRLVWELTYGPIPDGMWVLHRCDNPPCCNPDHLFLGDARDNALDMHAKGRACDPRNPGEANGNARLTSDQVTFMRMLRSRGATLQQLADLFGVANGHVHKITKRQLWASI